MWPKTVLARVSFTEGESFLQPLGCQVPPQRFLNHFHRLTVLLSSEILDALLQFFRYQCIGFVLRKDRLLTRTARKSG
jgi:hypothetical protein